jgi:hypothetical protein
MKKASVTVLAMVLAASMMCPYLMANPRQAAAGVQVFEVKLGKGVTDRQLTDETAEFAVNDKVYLWMKVTGAAGDTLTATWKTGEQTYTSELAVGGSPWRTWCYKTAALAGDWTVTVSDSKGNILKEISFKVK